MIIIIKGKEVYNKKKRIYYKDSYSSKVEHMFVVH